MEGDWRLQVATEGNSNLMPSESEAITIRVLQKPGYAILCLGSVPATQGNPPEGVDDHRRTMDYVKAVLASDAGLTDDTENPNTLSDDIYEITSGDPKTKLEEAIKEWAAQKMNNAPAPLYIVMINHGEIDKFHMNADLPDSVDNVLIPSELNSWLSDLEAALSDSETGNPLAAEEKIVVVLGMCFSGSFMDELSKSGRIVVSASARDERSIRGPSDADLSNSLARHGEYFVYLLFRELRNGLSFLDSFETSRDAIRQVSSGFELAIESEAPEFPGELGQHPLLDDNGDGLGSFNFGEESGDGKVAENLFLLTPTNSIGTLEVARTHPSLFLETGEDAQGLLWAEVDERPRNVNSIFMEVKKPGQLDPDAGDQGVSESMQAGLELARQLMLPEDRPSVLNRVRYEWPGLEANLELFDPPGIYKIFYYAKAASDFQPSEPKVSFLFRGSGVTEPSPFRLMSPENGATIDINPVEVDPNGTFGIFRWEESQVESGDVQYIFRLWKDEDRNNLLFETDLTIPPFVSFNPGELPLQPVYWDVVAVDTQGNARISQDLFQVEIVETNPDPIVGGLAGTLLDKETGVRITAPGTVFVSDDATTVQTPNNAGFYTKKVRSGTYVVRAEITGYKPVMQTEVTVPPGPPVTLDIELERLEEPVTQRRLGVNSNPPSTIAFIEGTQNGLTNFEAILNDNFSVQLKAPSTIIDGDTGYRFVRWRKSTASVPVEEVIEQPDLPQFNIDADTDLVVDYEEIGFDLKAGWNLVSSPVSLQSTSGVSDIFPSGNDTSTDRKTVWTWVDERFRVASNLKLGAGYWINETQPQLIPTRGTTPATFQQILRKGWNLVGVRGFKSISQPTATNNIGPVWAWDNENQRYCPIDSDLTPEIKRGRLMPGEAYWIYARSLTPLKLGTP